MKTIRFGVLATLVGLTFRVFAAVDFTAATVSISPNPATTGGSVNIGYQIMNQGTTSSSSPMLVQFYLSTNSTRDGGDAPLGTVVVSGVSAGSTTFGSVTRTLSAATSPGTWYIITEADSSKTVTESNESNNTGARSFTVVSSGSYTLTVTKSGTGSGTVTSSPSGVSCGATCSASYSPGTAVTLFATPASGSTFAGWTGACSGTGSCSLSMTSSRSVTATFTASSSNFTLSVSKSGNGSGVVTSNPSGISCGSTCQATYGSGTTVTLSASASTGSTFSGWSGACSGTGSCIMTMTSNRSVTATFAAAAWPDLTASVVGLSPSSLQPGQTLSTAYLVTNQGTASADSQIFVEFSLSANSIPDSSDKPLMSTTIPPLGAGSSYTGVIPLTIPADTPAGTWYILAEADSFNSIVESNESNNTGARSFTVQPPATSVLTVTKSGTGSGTVTSSPSGISCGSTCSASYSSGTSVSLSATASAGSTFSGWSNSCSGTGSCVVSMSSNRAVTATFDTMLHPDLVPSIASLTPASLQAGQSLSIAYSVANQGTGTAASTVLRLFLSSNSTLDGDAPFGSDISIPSLGAGSGTGTITITRTIPAATAQGLWYVIAQADAGGTVSESSESNNAASRSFQINSRLPPTASITASPASIIVGESATLNWSTTNAGTVSIDNGIGPVSASGSLPVYPQATTRYTVTASGSSTATASTTIVVNPAPDRPLLASIRAIPDDIQAGRSILLVWETSGASSAAISGIGTVELNGSRVVTPTADTTYRLTATERTNTTISEVFVNVRAVPKPVISVFTATPDAVEVGQQVTLHWSSTGGKSAALDGDEVPLNGSATVTPRKRQASTYTLVVDGAGGRTTKTVSVIVSAATPPLVETTTGRPLEPGSEDGSGPAATFKNPAGIGVDPANYAFVIDSGNHTIRRIAPDGKSETWAGQPAIAGFRDGCRSGCPTTALFNFSNFDGAMLVRGDGSLVVTDASNRIRFVDPRGKVTTCASASCARFSVAGIAELRNGSGIRYEADTGANTILKVLPGEKVLVFAGKSGEAGFQDGIGGAARFRNPRGIAVDQAGNVYVGDTGNNAVRKITPDGNVTTLAALSLPGPVQTNGASSARFSFGCCGGQVVVDPEKGTVYVTDTGSNTIKEITPGGEVSTILGSGATGSENGSGAQASFNEPQGVAWTPDGRLLITDTGNHTIRSTSPLIENAGPCVPSATTACMLNNRFRVTLRYRNGFDGAAADTNASVKTVAGFASPNFETAFFYFNNESNIELMVKILDQGNTNASGQQTIAVLFGSATPLGVALSVVDTVTGVTRTYFSAFNSMRGQTDFTAFVK